VHALESHGIETRIFDCTFQTFAQFQSSLVAYHPDIVGIYCMVTLSRNTFRAAEMIRRTLPDCLLAAGGPLPTLYPDHFKDWFDVIFRGESDLSFPQFCRAYFDQKFSRQQLNRLPLESFPGLFLQQADLSIDNPVVHYTEKELATFPLPYRGDFDHLCVAAPGAPVSVSTRGGDRLVRDLLRAHRVDARGTRC
jgi:anaerobic magnesium-protoporphyrin IX monomethyl ester cyclase